MEDKIAKNSDNPKIPIEKKLKIKQKFEDIREMMYLFLMDSSLLKLKFGSFKDFLNEFGLNNFFRNNRYLIPAKFFEKKSYTFLDMIRDAPILAELLDWFKNFCILDFDIVLIFSESTKLEIKMKD